MNPTTYEKAVGFLIGEQFNFCLPDLYCEHIVRNKWYLSCVCNSIREVEKRFFTISIVHRHINKFKVTTVGNISRSLKFFIAIPAWGIVLRIFW